MRFGLYPNTPNPQYTVSTQQRVIHPTIAANYEKDRRGNKENVAFNRPDVKQIWRNLKDMKLWRAQKMATMASLKLLLNLTQGVSTQ